MKNKARQLQTYLTMDIKRSLLALSPQLRTNSKRRLGLLQEVPIYVADPHNAAFDPASRMQKIEIRLEPGLSDGPTSSRFAVVDFDIFTGTLAPPVRWDDKERTFLDPENGQPLVAGVANDQSHQLSLWASAQRVLELFESPLALGRSIPWAFQGNRLLLVPHAAYGTFAIYDRDSKSVQFSYFGEADNRHYTCLAQDIIAHVTAQAILDGINPHYREISSWETAAFQEYISQFAALLLAPSSESNLISAAGEALPHVAPQSRFLQPARKVTMAAVRSSTDPRQQSLALTSAMLEIWKRIAQAFLAGDEDKEKLRYWLEMEEEIGDETTDTTDKLTALANYHRSVSQLPSRMVTIWAASHVRRLALQPLDLCPPVDIRFIDYIRAVLHYSRLSDQFDRSGYREIISSVFHEWKFCRRTDQEHVDGICDFNYQDDLNGRPLIKRDMESIARSRTSAYLFLNDNRELLRIPANQDLSIVDLFDTHKQGPASEAQPQEIVLKYLWREPVKLVGQEFGGFQGQTRNLLCGGTIVFNSQGQIISWMRKPGTEHSADRFQGLQRRNQFLSYLISRIRAESSEFLQVEEDLF